MHCIVASSGLKHQQMNCYLGLLLSAQCTRDTLCAHPTRGGHKMSRKQKRGNFFTQLNVKNRNLQSDFMLPSRRVVDGRIVFTLHAEMTRNLQLWGSRSLSLLLLPISVIRWLVGAQNRQLFVSIYDYNDIDAWWSQGWLEPEVTFSGV